MADVQILPRAAGSLTLAAVNSTNSTIAAVAGVSNKLIKVYKLFLVVGGITNLTFQDGSNALSGPLPLVANSSVVLNIDGTAWFPCSLGNAFNIVNSGSAQVSGTVYYYLENS